MAYELVTAPTVEPLALAEVKDYHKIEESADDTLIYGLIISAREHVEKVTSRAFITQTWDLFLDTLPTVVLIHHSPLQSVTSFKYIDTGGIQQTWGASKYRVDSKSEPARITPAHGEVWPAARAVTNAIEIRFIAGYGAVGSDVPRTSLLSMLALIGAWYENREAISSAPNLREVPMSVKRLLVNEKVKVF